MSFGWSTGDITAAFQLLHKVAIALKDASGASRDYQDVSSFLNILTVTLQHLSALQFAPLDPNLSQNLAQLCEQVHAPLTTFCEQIQTSFEKDLGSDSKRLKFLTTGRKLQWALSTSKKVKDLREKIAGPISAIGLVLGQQIVQNTLQMPFEIQARIAHTIDTTTDTKIIPMTLAVQKEVEKLSMVQRTSSAAVEGMIKGLETSTASEIQKYNREITMDLRDGLNELSLTQKNSSEHVAKLQGQLQKSLNTIQNSTEEMIATSTKGNEMITALSTSHSKSTDLILRTILENGNKTTAKNKTAFKEQTLSLHQKLEGMNFLMEAVKDRVTDLSVAQQSTNIRRSHSEIEKAIQNIQHSVWLLLSGLHVLIRELIYLLAPYIALLYRSSIQPLLLCGDHFLFEDGIGRRKWLPCVQFQHWDVLSPNFYKLLINTFQGEVGLTRVLNGQFMVLNGFNEVPISKKAWRAGIQPKSRVSMAFMLEAVMIRKGRCANPSCPGEVEFQSEEVTRICPVCKKHLSTLPDDPSEDADYSSETAFNFDFGSEIHMPIPEEEKKEQPKKSSVRSPKLQMPFQVLDPDIAAYKRVIWQASNKHDVQEPLPDGDPTLRLLSLHQNWHRRRGFKGKQRPVLRAHKRSQLKPEKQTKQTEMEAFFCRDLQCSRNSDGFATSMERDQHEADHKKPEQQTKLFICRYHRCPRRSMGFTTSIERDQHEADHAKRLKAEQTRPVKPEQQTETFFCRYPRCPKRPTDFTTSIERDQHEVDYHEAEQQTETFFCRYPRCPRHPTGFTTSIERDQHEADQHEADHIKPMPCSDPSCEYFGVEFRWKPAWHNHQ